jgi:predicted metal-dependent phosphoesterase TrpH
LKLYRKESIMKLIQLGGIMNSSTLAIIIIFLTSALLFGQTFEFQVPQWQGLNWYKGNTHAHTINSDGNAGPYEVAKWYKDHGYDFLSITDHNQLTDPATIKNIQDSTFRLIPGNEVSASNKNVLNDTQERSIHLNGLNISKDVSTSYAGSVVETLQQNIDAIRDAHGVPHLNHPNFYWSYGAKEMLQLENFFLFEIANMHPLGDNEGSIGFASTEEMWDEMLTAGKRIYGIATDDAHDYRSYLPLKANPGRGWVVVKASKLDAGEIVHNLEHGLFYASSGVELNDIVVTPNKLEIFIKEHFKSKYRTEFISDSGKVLQTTGDNPAVFELKEKATYIRAKVYSSNGFFAWVQPIFVK